MRNNQNQWKKQERCRLWGVLSGCLVLMCVGTSWSAVVQFTPNGWNSAVNKIIRDGQAMTPAAFDTIPNLTQTGVDYQYIQDNYLNIAISHSGTSQGNPKLHQHVYAYSLPIPQADVAYDTTNQSGHSRTLILTEEESGRKTNRRAVVQSNVVLDGSLLLVKSEEMDSYFGQKASFQIQLFKELKNGQRKIFNGKVALVGRKNGTVAIQTAGRIRKKYISQIIETDDTFQIVFDDVELAYRTGIRIGQNYVINTDINSQVVTTGAGSGAEVNFSPMEPQLLSYLENRVVVPEPTTLAMLILGGVSVAVRYRSRRY